MKILAIANQKGGVSKTTTSLNLAYCLSNSLGKRVLLIDADQQGSAGQNVGIDVADPELYLLDDLLEPYVQKRVSEFNYEDIKKCIYHPTFESRKRDPLDKLKWVTYQEPFGFDIIPSRLYLSIVEMYMSFVSGVEKRGVSMNYLSDMLKVIEEHVDYDYVIIDCPPSLGTMSINALAAARDGVIAVSNLDVMSLRGMEAFIETVNTITANRENHRGILGILLTLYSERRRVDQSVQEWVQKFLPIPTFDTKIPDSTKVKQANSMMLLYSQIDKKGREAFEALAKEIDFAVNHPDVLIGSTKLGGSE